MEVKIGKRLTLEDVALVAQGRATVSLHEDAYRQIERSRALYYEAVEKGLPIYGVTTMSMTGTGAGPVSSQSRSSTPSGRSPSASRSFVSGTLTRNRGEDIFRA